jgi:hypothetical protein
MLPKFLSFYGFLCVISTCIPTSVCGQFVLSKQQPKKAKKLSPNKLRESIGQEIRNAFTISNSISRCTGSCQITMSKLEEVFSKSDSGTSCDDVYRAAIPLQKTLGTLHMVLADVQQKFSQLIERLIDNQRPFKGASRDKLNSAWQTLQEGGRSLKEYEVQIVSLNKRLAKVTDGKVSEKVATLVNFNKLANNAIENVKKYMKRINSCDSLKIS